MPFTAFCSFEDMSGATSPRRVSAGVGDLGVVVVLPSSANAHSRARMNGGELVYVSPTSYRVARNTGESLVATKYGTFFGLAITRSGGAASQDPI
jgi:hypothetical protein